MPPSSAEFPEAGRPLRAVLFDMDGTLTDTERLWGLALDEVAATLGGRLAPASRAALVGLPMRQSIDVLHSDVGVERDWQLTAAELTEQAATYFGSELPWRPGASALLESVRAAGLRTALVTATERALVELAFNTLGRHNFDAVVTGDDVTVGKPDPEPYLRALAALGVDAGDALAIEDSPNGVASAVAAGLAVLVVPCEVPVPAGERRHFADTLDGLTVEYLRSLSLA